MMDKIVKRGLLFLIFCFGGAVHAAGPVTAVDMHMGIPVFTIDGHPEVTQTFETYEPTERHFRQFSEAGCKIYGFPANCAAETWEHSRPVWVGPEVWDYSEFDENVAKILRAAPDALIVPRIHVSEPEWWRKQNPADLMVFHDGTKELRNPFRLWPAKKTRTYASMASSKWRQDMAMCLRRLIDHIQESSYADHIFGYQIFGLSTEEWIHYTFNRPQVGDYSGHMTAAFQEWLRKKYWNVEDLRAAWNDDRVEFFSVTIPSYDRRFNGARERTFRDPATEMHTIDFYQFYNEIVPETIDYFASVVKEATNRQKAVGAFYAYMYEFAGSPESGHMAVEKLLRSENVDFIVVTASYGQRMLGKGGSILRSPHTSLVLHEKLWFEDNDNVSFLFPQVSKRIGDAEWQRSMEVLAATENAEETKWIYQRGAGFTLGNGLHQSFFDLHGGYFDHPQIMKDVKDLYRVFENSINRDRSSCSEILVIADERSTLYCTLKSALLGQNLLDPPYRMIKCGAPYDSVYLNDLALMDTSRYKLFIVLNAFHMTDDQMELVNRKLRKDGKTLFWIYAPGMFNGNQTLPRRVSQVAGMEIVFSENEQLIAPTMTLRPQGFCKALIDQGMTEAGPSSPSCRAVTVRDPEAQVLGIGKVSGEPVLAAKNVNGVRSVYSVTASLPPSFYRELARDAGVHIYNNRDDTLYVSRSYLTVNADGAGPRRIQFPVPVDIYDAVTEEKLAARAVQLTLDLRDKETRMLRIER